MSEDIALMARADKSNMSPDMLSAVGGGTYIFEMFSNDLQFDGFGLMVMTSGTDKLVQSSLKILVTEPGENFEDAQYGSLLAQYIGEKITSGTYTNIANGVADTLRYYNFINQDNDEPTEFVESIDNVSVFRNEQDPRQINVRVDMTAESGDQVSISMPVIQ